MVKRDKKRKYITEFCLNTYVSYKSLFPIEYLYNIHDDDHQYHIYLILSYPQVYFSSYVLHEKYIIIKLFNYVEAEKREYELKFALFDDFNHKKIEIHSEYPYTKLSFIINDESFRTENEYTEIEILTQDLFNRLSYDLLYSLEFDIQYIGQAFGQNGERLAINRLLSHSTLQKIITEKQIKNSDKHFYILLLQIDSNLRMSMDGLSKEHTKSYEEDSEHVRCVLSNLPKYDQVINITEAALIN